MEEVYAERYFRALKRRLALGRSAVGNSGVYAERLVIVVIAVSKSTAQEQPMFRRSRAQQRIFFGGDAEKLFGAAIRRLRPEPPSKKVSGFAADNKEEAVAKKPLFALTLILKSFPMRASAPVQHDP